MKLVKILPWLSVFVLTTSQTSFAEDVDISKILEDSNKWDFDAFELNDLVEENSLPILVEKVFEKHDLYDTFQISREPLKNFLNRLVLGYQRYNASYHNYMHAVDVVHTVDFIISLPVINNVYTPLAKLAFVFAAAIHDNEHMGTTNDFHINSQSDRALIYNDQSVNENHHLYASFSLLKQDDCNFLSHLPLEYFQGFRTLVIYMVLNTDMSKHSELITVIENLNDYEYENQLVLGMMFILHAADISNAAKPWSSHNKWTMMLMEEMYAQGDMEKILGLEVCAICDRNTNVPEVAINFIDVYVMPTFRTLGNLLKLFACKRDVPADIPQTWYEHIEENRKKWTEMI